MPPIPMLAGAREYEETNLLNIIINEAFQELIFCTEKSICSYLIMMYEAEALRNEPAKG